MKDTDRMNTVLDETFQNTVRQRMYIDDDEDDMVFETAKDNQEGIMEESDSEENGDPKKKARMI